MIIFGTRGITTTPNRGAFHCPSCRTDCDYKQKRVRRFFTLYFIPVIPLDKLGEYVECAGCRSTFNSAVLDWNPEDQAAAVEAAYQTAIKQVMIHMLLADGQVDDAEVDASISVYREVTGSALDRAALLEDIMVAQSQPSDISASLKAISMNLNDEGKEMVLRAALLVALADGEFQQEEQIFLTSVGRDLGMSDAHITGVISHAQGA